MKKYGFILLGLFTILLFQSANATMYECKYKSKNGAYLTSSFNTLNKAHPRYKEMYGALKNGDCKELIIKRYFLDGVLCNIQFYKYNKEIATLSCPGNKQSSMAKLKAIARKDYGYYK